MRLWYVFMVVVLQSLQMFVTPFAEGSRHTVCILGLFVSPGW